MRWQFHEDMRQVEKFMEKGVMSISVAAFSPSLSSHPHVRDPKSWEKLGWAEGTMYLSCRYHTEGDMQGRTTV